MAPSIGKVAGISFRVDPPLWPVTKPSKSEDGQATMTVTVPQDLNKHKVQSSKGAPRAKCPCKAGKPRGDKKHAE